MAVKVQFEIGHTSKLRSKKTPHPQSFTHDWEIYVQGVNKADISAFVEKVVFLLHESFPKPKRVFKEPPYALQESGYAGFLLPVEIHFRNRDDPKRITYQYDLSLQTTGPPQHRVQVKTHIFEAPSEEFRAKLMRGGGVPVFGANVATSNIARTLSPSVAGADATSNNEIGVVKGKGGSAATLTNADLGAGKKHKSRNEDPAKSNAFSALFGPPITKGSASANNLAPVPATKHSPEGKNLPGGGGGKSGSHDGGKEKTSKERDKSSGGDKPREKDKKDRHGRDKDRKSSKSGDSSKHEHKEKSKKDKTRDKERDRDQSSSSTASSAVATAAIAAGVTAGSLAKHTASPKPGKPTEMSAPSPKKTATDSTTAAPLASRSKERDEHKSGKSESKDKERSSGKKSKKDKKDKDKDRDRDREKQRDEHKDKRLPKDDRIGQTDSPAGGNTLTVSQQSHVAVTGKATPTSVGSNSSSSTVSSKHKEDATGGKHPEKPTESKTDKGTSNGNASEPKKSHKHKKKDKNKDKDKDRNDRDKEKDKERDKDKPKEREKDKQQAITTEKPSLTEPSPKTGGASPSTEGAATDKTVSSANASNSSSKKEKHKKSKEKSSKDEKRPRDAAGDKDPDAKNDSKQQAQSKAPSNLDLSDVDSAQSAPDLAATTALAAAAAATLQHSDSSNSSFPDLPARSSINSQQKPSKANTGSGKDTKPAGNKEHKAKSKQSEKAGNKAEKADKPTENKSEKMEKPEKEEKTRNRRSSQNSNNGGGFIEPPVKSTKKEPNKAPREKSKSPSLRPPRETNSSGPGSGSGTPNAASGGFLQPPQSSPGTNHTGAVGAAPNMNNHNANNSGHSPADINTPAQLQLPTEYLSELQELHHKIMTLQDNEELQHVVEMIAATGCYEITHKTFDFDLCKLDRSTVQRLQEFLATSVS
ncbi:protein ENL [Drosophila bipectinata]|uniref:protein ENL n=1 Tax=Drosophila bipectinata TaxID=42026 RepID=UPI001C8A7325|nr:protein AF-9 [Drosophila bipectinata]